MSSVFYPISNEDRGLGKGSGKQAGSQAGVSQPSTHLPVPYIPPQNAFQEIITWLGQGPRSQSVGPPIGVLRSPGLYQASARPNSRFLLHIDSRNAVFQDSVTGRFYTQTKFGFAQDVSSITAIYTRSAQSAQGMVLLAEIEMEFLAGVLTSLPGVGQVSLALTVLRLGTHVFRRRGQISRALPLIHTSHRWLRQSAPNTYNYILRTLIVQIGTHIPSALDARAIARVAGILVGSLGTGALNASVRLLRVFSTALRRALQAVPGQAISGATRQAQQAAQNLTQQAQLIQRHFQLQGLTVAATTAMEIAREYSRSPDLPNQLNRFMSGVQILAGLADPLQQDILASIAGNP